MEETTKINTTEDSTTIETTKREWMSESIEKLGKALAIAQSKMKGAASKSVNPFFNSKYADLHTVLDSCLPYLNKEGLSVVQGNEYDMESNGFYVTTTLIHESGQWIRSRIRMPIGTKRDAHAVGSATTYGRRYGLSGLVGIAQFDDDGNSISAPPRTNTKTYPKDLKIENAPNTNSRKGVPA